jgi:uncharacterized membrane protein
MSTSLPIELIEKQDWLEPIAEQLQPTIAAALDDNGSIGPTYANILHGTWLGHPLHAVLTDLPIGSWTAAAVFDLLEQTSGSAAMGRKADAAIAFGLIGATAAAVTGLADWSKVGPDRPRRIGLAHGILNLAATACYVTSLCLRRIHSRRAGRRFAMAGFMISNLSAYLGGHLVYNERIGVDHTAGFSPPKDFFPVLTESELSDNELRRVDADGMPVLASWRTTLRRPAAGYSSQVPLARLLFLTREWQSRKRTVRASAACAGSSRP